MKLKVDPEFQAFIPPLSGAEYDALEASIVSAGRANEPITVWRGTVVDGHNRYSICTRLGLPFTTRELDAPDREAVKAWMFQHQIARRNLSVGQIATLAALRGLPAPPGRALEYGYAQTIIAHDRTLAEKVLSGRLTLRSALFEYKRATGQLPPRPPRGPSTKPAIPKGHELAGVSTLTGPDGEVKAEWNKTRGAGADEPPQAIPDNFHLSKASVMQRADGTTVVQWSSWEPERVAQWEATKAAIVEHVNTYVKPSPAPPAPVVDWIEDQLSVYNLGDPHIGMMAWAAEVGESFDLKIAERELCKCFELLVDRAPRTRRAIIANLGDFWHAQDDSQRTPRGGNKLDVDGRSGKVGRVGLAIVRTLIDSALLKHAAVEFRSLPGNHDPNSAFWLPEVMRAAYLGNERVTVHDAFAPYQYDRFGSTLLAWCHGDGAKLDALPGLMATDVPELWGATEHRYWNVGHVHHWSEKELPGVVVTTHRTLAGRDAWHHHSGYRSRRSLKVQTYHERWGLDSVAVVGIERVRAALSEKGKAA
jgi:hypothetical protein